MKLLLLSLCLAPALASASSDAWALVQGGLQMHRAGAEEHAMAGETIKDTPDGPMAYTKLGPVVGKYEENFTIFAGVPYAEMPERFEVSEPKKPWSSSGVYDARNYKSACIGAGVGSPESEDCHYLNIWAPKGEHKNMPVIVYFHGGINQHGSGSEVLRRGDMIVQSQKYPTIFINFDFRLGVFGWISLKGSNISENLGLQDQQAALRWVRDNIAAFGGDPSRVTLQGQSEGSGIILTHMAAPGSKGLFHRVAMHSPVADFWSRRANPDRTDAVIRNLGCQRPKLWSTVRCLRRKAATVLWSGDWVAEELSRTVGSKKWIKNFVGLLEFFALSKDRDEVAGQLGWHAVVDGSIVPEEPREAVRKGNFHKVPVLITFSKNESYGCIPGGNPASINAGLQFLLKKEDQDWARYAYNQTLIAQGINGTTVESLGNQILTDKLWTCDARSLADDLTAGGGRAHVGMFWHSPLYDPVGMMTSQVCTQGATCHAAEMLYVLPQGEPRGIHGPGMEAELAFSQKYSESFLAFVHGEDGAHPWRVWDKETEPVTFYDKTGSWVVPHYRKPQCDVLDRSVGDHMPAFMRQH